MLVMEAILLTPPLRTCQWEAGRKVVSYMYRCV